MSDPIQRSISNLPEWSREVAKMAATNGVIIHPLQVHDEISMAQLLKAGERPNLKLLQEIVGGFIEIVEVSPRRDAPTVLVVNEEGRLSPDELPFNSAVGAIFGYELYGNVIWLPRNMIMGD